MKNHFKENHIAVKALTKIIKGMCRYADDVQIEERQISGDKIQVTVALNAADQPFIVGKRGQHIKALKIWLQELSEFYEDDIYIWLEEPYKGEREKFPPFIADDDWNINKLVPFVKAYFDEIKDMGEEPVIHYINVPNTPITKIMVLGLTGVSEESIAAGELIIKCIGENLGRHIKFCYE
jgi:predicted RNA-binding protein YlqC (UPF0109 family)